jgi:hypothetical protein
MLHLLSPLPATAHTLLADADALLAGSRYLQRSSSPTEYALIVVALAAIALFWTALIYWDRIRARFARRPPDPKSLFLELCHAHGLDAAERGLLWHAAELSGLQQPAYVFVDPRILSGLSASAGPHASEFGQLSHYLFGDLLQGTDAQPSLSVDSSGEQPA